MIIFSVVPLSDAETARSRRSVWAAWYRVSRFGPTRTVWLLQHCARRIQLLSLLKDRPMEVYDRLHMQASDLWQFYRTPESLPENHKCSWREILVGISAAVGESLEQYLEESALQEIRDQIRWRMDDKLTAPPFMLRFNGDQHLTELCYLACRAMKPSLVVETGVAYGVMLRVHSPGAKGEWPRRVA